MNPGLAIRIVGCCVMAFVFYHFWALWGLILGLGMMMVFLP